MNDVPNDLQIKMNKKNLKDKPGKNEDLSKKNKIAKDEMAHSHTVQRILYKEKSKLTCVKNYNCTYNFSRPKKTNATNENIKWQERERERKKTAWRNNYD